MNMDKLASRALDILAMCDVRVYIIENKDEAGYGKWSINADSDLYETETGDGGVWLHDLTRQDCFRVAKSSAADEYRLRLK